MSDLAILSFRLTLKKRKYRFLMGTNDILISVDVVTHVAIAKVFTPDFCMISVLFLCDVATLSL